MIPKWDDATRKWMCKHVYNYNIKFTSNMNCYTYCSISCVVVCSFLKYKLASKTAISISSYIQQHSSTNIRFLGTAMSLNAKTYIKSVHLKLTLPSKFAVSCGGQRKPVYSFLSSNGGTY
jgi:hypothetical protein